VENTGRSPWQTRWRKLNASADDVVLVHDAVRPFVDDEIIANVVHEVEKHGAAIAGLPAVDTIKQVERAAKVRFITFNHPAGTRGPGADTPGLPL